MKVPCASARSQKKHAAGRFLIARGVSETADGGEGRADQQGGQKVKPIALGHGWLRRISHSSSHWVAHAMAIAEYAAANPARNHPIPFMRAAIAGCEPTTRPSFSGRLLKNVPLAKSVISVS
jgi:hypothetical protein